VARASGASAIFPVNETSPGRIVPSPDVLIGDTRICVVELPVFGLTDPGKPIVAVYAGGTGAGWRRAALSLRDNSAQIEIGATTQSAIIGSSLEPLSPHTPHLIDERRGLRVQMVNAGMDIANRSGSPLDGDAPIFWLSGEFIRYGNCEDLGNGVYRFSRLLRGCFGSEDAVLHHPVSSPFVLIDSDSAHIVDERIFGAGDIVQVEAMGLGDLTPATGTARIKSLAITPLAPVHGYMKRAPDNELSVRWIRRSRIDNGWKDGVDQLMAEEREQYRVALFAQQNLVGEWVVDTPEFTLSGNQYSQMGLDEFANLTAEIRQSGRYAQSAPAAIHLPSSSA
jgi:hypothetical protein